MHSFRPHLLVVASLSVVLGGAAVGGRSGCADGADEGGITITVGTPLRGRDPARSPGELGPRVKEVEADRPRFAQGFVRVTVVDPEGAVLDDALVERCDGRLAVEGGLPVPPEPCVLRARLVVGERVAWSEPVAVHLEAGERRDLVLVVDPASARPPTPRERQQLRAETDLLDDLREEVRSSRILEDILGDSLDRRRRRLAPPLDAGE